MNQELFSNKEIWLVPCKGIQASLRFWIPCCWFRIPGIVFQSFGKWNLDSGFLEQYSRFQSPGFRIPRAKKFPDSWIWIPLIPWGEWWSFLFPTGILPLLVSNPTDSSESSQSQCTQSCDTPSKTESDALTSCYQTIVESIRTHNPQLISELQGFIMELRRITLLWEELWHGSLMQTHHDVTRRQQQLEEEINRVNSNQNLTSQQKATLIREKHIAIMKPVSVEEKNHETSENEWYVPGMSFINPLDHYTFLGNCPLTPPLSQHFALSEK